MTTRTRESTVAFSRPFRLPGVDRLLPPGTYRVVTDEELIEELSFPVYRRVSTVIFIETTTGYAASTEMVTVAPQDLRAAQIQDGSEGAATGEK